MRAGRDVPRHTEAYVAGRRGRHAPVRLDVSSAPPPHLTSTCAGLDETIAGPPEASVIAVASSVRVPVPDAAPLTVRRAIARLPEIPPLPLGSVSAIRPGETGSTAPPFNGS